MFSLKLLRLATGCAVLACLVVVSSAVSRAQGGENLDELMEQARALMKQNRNIEALPLLDRIVAAEPTNAEMQYQLASALIGQTAVTDDAATRKSLRLRARAAFIKARENGDTHPVVEAMILSIPLDGSDPKPFSENTAAQTLMTAAEASFSQGKFDDALRDYQRALALDSHLYDAALFSGDVFMEKGDYNGAEFWYQRAIAIDPNRETAYRYSATPLMKQGKKEEARDRYIEAFIVEPYSRFARAGFLQWGQVTKTQLAHPDINIPTSVTFDEKGDAKINLDASALLGGKDDGSFAWIAYGATRTEWHKTKFATTFPNEKTYRHSLAEEADALRSVLAIATADKKTKSLSQSLAKLKKLNDEGLLEAYILLARPDQGIARDHPAYLKENRDKLRRYVVTYVVTGGGN